MIIVNDLLHEQGILKISGSNYVLLRQGKEGREIHLQYHLELLFKRIAGQRVFESSRTDEYELITDENAKTTLGYAASAYLIDPETGQYSSLVFPSIFFANRNEHVDVDVGIDYFRFRRCS